MLRRHRKMRRRPEFGRGGLEDSCVLSRLLRRCCEVSATRGLVHAWISTRASMVLRNCHNFHDFRRLAKRRLPGPIFDYIDGAADDETTHRRNTKAFESCDLVPSVLRGVGSVDLSVTVMGQKLALPIYCSPTALQRLFHHQGERAVAAAAAKYGTMFGVSSLGTVSLDELRKAHDTSQIYQFYFFRLPQLEEHIDMRGSALSIGGYFTEMLDPSMNWDDVAEMVRHWNGQFCLKGVMSPADAKHAADIGCTGIVVSNHGGRQLDGSRASFDQLAEIVDAVGDRIDVLMDGGVQRGTHVLKALSVGAKAVGVGRYYLYPLSAAGQAGVERALGLMKAELERDMKLMGCIAIGQLSRDNLRLR